MNLNDLLQNISIGVSSGIISSAIFLIILSSLKPRITISDKIASEYITLNGKHTHIYIFKIINKSLFYKIYDLKVNAYVCESIPNVNGTDIKFKDINLKGCDQWVLNKLNYRHLLQDFRIGEKTLKTRCDYAAQFTTSDNLATLLSNNSYIAIQVLAKHSLTGFSRVKIMHYHHISKIKKGCFLSGNSCKIIDSPDVNKTITVKPLLVSSVNP